MSASALQLPLSLIDSAPWSPTLRHERRTISDAVGRAVAFVDYTTRPDPLGISGEGAHLIQLRTSEGFAFWDALCDAIGVSHRAPGRAIGEVELRGPERIAELLARLQTLTGEPHEAHPEGN